MKIKKSFSFLLIFCILFPITSCSTNIIRPITEDTEITLWTYPVGDWGNEAVVNELVRDFTEVNPEITVKTKFLDYKSGDKEVEEAIRLGKAPNLILEGPERLVADWGRRGLMEDLADLYTDASKDIYENVVFACRSSDGKFYEYPLCMATHCMAINKRIFEETNALQYVNLSNYTWTTKDFLKAVETIYRHGYKDVLKIYCKSKSGDQGSRALVNNLYDGTYTDDEHRSYTIDSSKNIAALSALDSCQGISIDSDLSSSDEIDRFRKGKLAISICWSPSLHNDTTFGQAGKTVSGDEIIPMHFPSPNGSSKLVGGIWGFGIFKNDDKNKIKASKMFIDYMANDEKGARNAVRISRFFPVHKGLTDVYVNTEISSTMDLFSKHFMLNMGDYYQITPGWTKVRSLWKTALQSISKGDNIRKTLRDCNSKANSIAKESNSK